MYLTAQAGHELHLRMGRPLVVHASHGPFTAGARQVDLGDGFQPSGRSKFTAAEEPLERAPLVT
jgi:hypothetical protein